MPKVRNLIGIPFFFSCSLHQNWFASHPQPSTLQFLEGNASPIFHWNLPGCASIETLQYTALAAVRLSMGKNYDLRG